MSDIKVMLDIVETANREILGHGFIERTRKTTEKFKVLLTCSKNPRGNLKRILL